MDIGDSVDSYISAGHLSALFRYPFPSLHTFILRDCWLISKDISSLARASREGKLPNLELLDISVRDWNITGELLSLLHHSLSSLKTLILRKTYQVHAEVELPLDIRDNVEVEELVHLRHDPGSGKRVTWKCFKFSFVAKQ